MLSAPRQLRCDFADCPLALASPVPNLSWWVSDNRPSELQSAYEILAASNAEALAADQADLWRSGKVNSDQCAYVAYAGTPLNSRQRVWWKVRTYDSDGLASTWSDAAWFETGLLDAEQWQGQWVAAPARGSRAIGVPVPVMRREFVLTEAVRSARLYIAAMGDYQIEINGARITDTLSNAVWSDFDRAVHYQAFDITDALIVEPNAIGVLLADGYYAGDIAPFGRANYGDRAALRVQLEITFVDGSITNVCSDEQWQWRPSWILATEPNGAEHADLRQYVDGWSFAGLQTGSWHDVDLLGAGIVALVPQAYPKVRTQQALRPSDSGHKSQQQGRECLYLDFAEHLSGRVQLDALCRGEDLVEVSYSLTADMSDAVTDTFTVFAATNVQKLAVSFALHGFRYVSIEYTQGQVEVSEVMALRYAAAEPYGMSLRCDHSRVNRLFEVLQNSVRSVASTVPMMGIAPLQRLGDVAWAGTWMPWVVHNPQMHNMVRKWLHDACASCFTTGTAGPFAPAVPRAQMLGKADEIAVFEAIVNTLWQVYAVRGESAELKRHYGGLRVAALGLRHRFTALVRDAFRSDLYGEGPDGGLVAGSTLYGSMRTMHRLAQILERDEDAEILARQAQEVLTALRGRYLTVDGHLAAQSMSAHVAVLYHNVLREDETAQVQGQLAQLLQQDNYHVDVCPAVLHAVLPTLTKAGRLDLAYVVLLQTSRLSWMGALEDGASLVGHSEQQMDMSQLGVMQWLLESLVGIYPIAAHTKDPADAMREVEVHPMPPMGHQFSAGAPIEFVETKLQTLHGVYEVQWRIAPACFECELVVPPGCSAWVSLPDGIRQQVRSGQHRFVMDFAAGGDGVPTLLDVEKPWLEAGEA